MALYAVAERRLPPGGLRVYLDVLKRVDAYLTRDPHRGPYSVYVAEGEPDRLLSAGLWRRREDLLAAAATLPPPLVRELEASVLEGEGSWEWFRSVRQRWAFSEPADVIAALRVRVAPRDANAFREWAVMAQEDAMAIPGVLTQHLLESVEDDGAFLHLAEYANHDAYGRAQRALVGRPPPVPMDGARRFVGRVRHYWDRFEALGERDVS